MYDSRLRGQVYTGFTDMKVSPLSALSPADGRYADKVGSLRNIFSEYGLIRFRVLVEVRWLQCLADEAAIVDLAPPSAAMTGVLEDLIDSFSMEEALRVKDIEATTNHDVKAVEYYIRDRIGGAPESPGLQAYLHFGCTSEDINNLAYALMLRAARDEVVVPRMRELRSRLAAMATRYADVPMLARTHGQAASPTTVGKEMANFVRRLEHAEQDFTDVVVLGKWNGAVGNFNAHVAAYPDADWPEISRRFIESLGLRPNTHTTQIEPHDWTAQYAHAVLRYNTVLIDFCRDIWGYVSLGYFRQKIAKDEVGSSTMPHKVNPIDFENAEGNLGISSALFGHFAEKLPISRWQRDLTDSTVQRNFGIAVGHTLIALDSAIRGLARLDIDEVRIAADLDEAWEVLGEAVQTVMRRYGIPDPYEKLKALTRGATVTKETLHSFIATLEIPKDERERLMKLTPQSYIGLADKLAKSV